MKRLLLSIITLASVAGASAAGIERGYYRVQNFQTSRYIIMVDNKTTGMNVNGGTFDINALRTTQPFSAIADDPATVFYIQGVGGQEYNLKAQGTDAFSAVGRYLTCYQPGGAPAGIYYAAGVAAGLERRLSDDDPAANPFQDPAQGVLKIQEGVAEELTWWKVMPVSATDDNNYFGVKPDVTVGTQGYTAFYASFPFTTASAGMKVYTVSKIDGDMAVMQELQGRVASSTPVIIACAGATASDNRLSIDMQDATAPAGNLLRGVYFNSSDWYGKSAYHFNATTWDAATMRVLGTTSKGKLGYVKNTKLKYVPRNKAYIVVAADAPDEITLMTQAEYDEEKAKDAVTVAARSYSREYGEENPTLEYDVTAGTLQGVPVLSTTATAASPVGTYPIVVEQGTVSNGQFNAVNGTLTVTAALLTVTAQSYTIKETDPVPAFAATFAGFKLAETADVLTAQPVFSCELPTPLVPGEYDITVSGAEAQNYAISYVAGKLTVTEADPITIQAKDATMVYGDDVPALEFTASADVDGLPVVTCEATPTSPVGEYAITVAAGTVTYPRLVLVPGKLTVTKAPLKVSVADYVREQGQPNPDFEILYDGFRNNETADVLTVKPTATCVATETSDPGFYDIVVSGGEAQNYELSYVNGKLEVKVADAISAVSVVYSQPVDVYTVDGRRVRTAVTSTAGLPRGLYVINGRKVVVR